MFALRGPRAAGGDHVNHVLCTQELKNKAVARAKAASQKLKETESMLKESEEKRKKDKTRYKKFRDTYPEHGLSLEWKGLQD